MKYLCLLLVITSVLPMKSVVAQNSRVSESNWYDLCKEINEKGATPVKASMISTLESPVNTLTGAVSFDIPVHTIELGSYSLPISLHYETSGFRATDIASNIGLGWSINGIGCIARTIKGFRDDFDNVGYDTGGFDYIEFLMDEENLNEENFDEENFDEEAFKESFPKLVNLTDGGFDGEPDLYSFNFAGHSGSFINNVDKYGRITNFNEHNIKIERGNDEYAFSITDEVGNIYYFGGGNSNERIDFYKNRQSCMKESYWESMESLQIRFASGDLGTDNEGDDDYDITWHLSRIEVASSDYVIDFEYAHDSVRVYLGTDEMYMFGHPFINAASLEASKEFGWVAHRFNRFKYAKMPRITKITWKKGNSELGSIIFVPESDYRFDLQNDAATHHGGHAISQIKVMNSDNSVNNYIYLKHSYNGSSYNGKTILDKGIDYSFYNTLFLDKLYYLDSNDNLLYSYEFSYDGEYKKIARNTSYIDMWGYVNNDNADSDSHSACRLIKPKIFYYENGKDNPLYNSVYSAWKRHGEEPTYILDGYDMTPNETLTVKHTLSSVKTPCGGIVSFGYEPNNFYFDSQTITGPGVRVKTVTYDGGYMNHQYKWRKKYSYTDDNGVTSGRVTSIPDYGYFNAIAYVENWQNINGPHDNEYNRNIFTTRQFSTVSDMTGTSQSVVRYSKVTVTDEGMGNTDGKIGKTEYHYRLGWNAGEDSICIGNNEYVHRTKTRRASYVQIIELGVYDASPYYTLQHKDSSPKFTEPITSWCGDYLTKEIKYDLNGKPVESTEYKYSLHPSNKTFAYLQSKYYIRYDVPWAILDFETGSIVDKFYNFQLDILWGANYYRTGSRRLDAIIQTRYSGETSNKTIKTFDYYNVGDVVNVVKSETVTNSDGNTVRNNYTYPFNYNVSPLNSMTNKNMLMTPVEQYTSVNGMVTDGAFVEYKEHGIFIKPDKAFRLHTTRPLSDFSPSNPGGNHDSRYDETISIKWDDTHANIIETREEGDVTTTYIWGYHNSLLVAKIENATYAEVTSYCNPEELQEKTNKELVEIFQYLRENLPNAMVTSYTYDTARNLLSVTDPSGKTASYEYDSASRLKITRDVEDNIINKYEYHYGSSKQ